MRLLLEKKFCFWPLIDFNWWVAVFVRQGSHIKVMHAPRISGRFFKTTLLRMCCELFLLPFFRITHLNYHGLLQLEYCWLCSIFLFLNHKEVIINGKIWEETEEFGPLLPHFSFIIPSGSWGVRVNTGPLQNQRQMLLLLIYTCYWRNQVCQV